MKLTYIQEQNIIKEYNNYCKINKICDTFNINNYHIYNTLKKYNIPKRTNTSRKYNLNDDFFKENTEKSFYWAGFIAADGCLRIKKSKYSNSHCLEIVSKDQDHLSKFMNDVNTDKPIYQRHCGISKVNGCEIKAFTATIYSETIFNDLNNIFSIHPNKTYNHSFPEFKKDNHLVRHFLRGYFDGDGGFYLNRSRKTPEMHIRICGTISFLEKYKCCIETGSNIESKSKPYMYNGQGALNYCGNICTTKIADYLYKNAVIYLNRKYEQYKGLLKNG